MRLGILLNYTVLKQRLLELPKEVSFGILLNYTILKPAPTSYRFTSSFKALVNYETFKQRNFNWRFGLLTNHAAIKLMLRDMADVHLHFQARKLQNERES